MKEKLINVHKLDNNQDLEVYDLSRKISEEGWVVIALIKITISVTDAIFKEAPTLTLSLDDVKKSLGERVLFEVRLERNFIADKNKDKEFNELVESYLQTNRSYLSRKSFPAKYVFKEYMKKTKRVHHYCK